MLFSLNLTSTALGLALISSNLLLLAYKLILIPASKTVTITYELPAAQSQVTLVVVDEQGKVITRKEQGRQSAGKHTHQLHALQEASPGTYFIRLKLGDAKQQVERVVKVE